MRPSSRSRVRKERNCWTNLSEEVEVVIFRASKQEREDCMLNLDTNQEDGVWQGTWTTRYSLFFGRHYLVTGPGLRL